LEKFYVFHGFRIGDAVNIADQTAIQSNNNITPEELVSVLEKLFENPEKGKSLIEELKEGLKSRAFLIEIVQKIIVFSKVTGLS
jgi:UDP-N-acetylglucosamine:LPS N-acetylglucosamine transferase